MEHDMSIVEYIHQISKTQYRHDGSKRNTPQAGMGRQLSVYAADDVGRCDGASKTFYPPEVINGTKRSSTSNPRSEMYCSVRRTIDWFGQSSSRGHEEGPT
jgi:hypothetical protein